MKLTRELFLLRMKTILDRDGSSDAALLMRVLEQNLVESVNVPLACMCKGSRAPEAHSLACDNCQMRGPSLNWPLPFKAPDVDELLMEDAAAEKIREILVRGDGYIIAIKRFRLMTGLGLKESKDAVDKVRKTITECICERSSAGP